MPCAIRTRPQQNLGETIQLYCQIVLGLDEKNGLLNYAKNSELTSRWCWGLRGYEQDILSLVSLFMIITSKLWWCFAAFSHQHWYLLRETQRVKWKSTHAASTSKVQSSPSRRSNATLQLNRRYRCAVLAAVVLQLSRKSQLIFGCRYVGQWSYWSVR